MDCVIRPKLPQDLRISQNHHIMQATPDVYFIQMNTHAKLIKFFLLKNCTNLVPATPYQNQNNVKFIELFKI